MILVGIKVSATHFLYGTHDRLLMYQLRDYCTGGGVVIRGLSNLCSFGREMELSHPDGGSVGRPTAAQLEGYNVSNM
jgi:hypothetical protein